MSKRPWVEGPWDARFRHVVAHTKDKDHPMRDWPDCTGKAGDGEFDCDEGCRFSEECKDEWENCEYVTLSITYLKNPGRGSQGDQVVHPIVDANAQLIALAPEMAEVLLELQANDVQVGNSEELAKKLQHIIDYAEQRAKRQAEWEAKRLDKANPDVL